MTSRALSASLALKLAIPALALGLAHSTKAAEPTTYLMAGLKMIPSIYDKDANMAKLEQFARKAAAAGAALIVTPEGYLEGYVTSIEQARHFTKARFLEVAEPPDGPYIRRAGALARELKVHLLLGFAERRGERVYNTAAIFGPGGDVVAHYSKSHLAGNESSAYVPGNELSVFASPLGRIGLIICYDRQLPETSRVLALKGAQIILVPAFGLGTTEINEDIMMRTRAYENGVYVAHVHPKNTFIVDPEGTIVAQAKGESEEIVLARIKLDERVGDGPIRSRRPELYKTLLENPESGRKPPKQEPR